MSERERDAQSADMPAATLPAITDSISPAEAERLLDKYSRIFTGTFAHTLDGKGRMVIPLAFRDMLGSTFTICPAYDFKSIAVYPELAYVTMREDHAKALKENPRPERVAYLQWLDAYTFRGQECDGQGRVLLPARIRQIILGEDKEIDIMGSGDHLRIAARVKCDDQLAAFIANIDNILSGMNAR